MIKSSHRHRRDSSIAWTIGILAILFVIILLAAANYNPRPATGGNSASPQTQASP